MLNNVKQFYTMLYNVIQCTMLYNVMQIQCYTTLYDVIQCYKMLYLKPAPSMFECTQQNRNECSLECTSLILNGLSDPSGSCDWRISADEITRSKINVK